MYVFLDPPPLPRVSIGLVQCVPSYTLSSPAFKGVTRGMNFKLIHLNTARNFLSHHLKFVNSPRNFRPAAATSFYNLFAFNINNIHSANLK